METALNKNKNVNTKNAPRFFGNGINGNGDDVSHRQHYSTAPRFFGNGINGNCSTWR